MSKHQYSVGCDPELFAMTEQGKPVSVHDKIPGTKSQPFQLPSGLGAIQVDGTSAEFNIKPAVNADQFAEHIQQVVTFLQERLNEDHPKLHLWAVPTVKYQKKYYNSLPPEAKESGCSPDFNHYTGKQCDPPVFMPHTAVAGGHLHLGWTHGEDVDDPSHVYDCTVQVEQMDHGIGLLAPLWDDDNERRKYYPLGQYRPKPFGVEWRTLSNAWVKDPDLHRWIFRSIVHGANLVDEDNHVSQDANAWSLRVALEQGKTLAKETLQEFHDYLVTEFGYPKLPEAYLT